MMKLTINGIFGCLLVIVLLNLPPSSTYATFSGQLPTDLIFTGWLQDNEASLARLDAETLEVHPFYTDKSAILLRAISWSPQGDVLVILRIEDSDNGSFYPTSICTLTITGEFRLCFDDKPSLWYSQAPSLIDYDYNVTWSADGSKIYFVTSDEVHHTRSLVEASTVTGKTLRTLYTTDAVNPDGIPTVITWAPQLSYAAVGIRLHEREGILINLKTQKQQELSKIIKAFQFDSIPEPPGAGFICDSFSPQGHYLTAIDETVGQIIIFDMQLQIQHIIGNFDREDSTHLLLDCPTWSSDERYIYFIARNLKNQPNTVFKYDLTTGEKSITFQGEMIYPTLVFSPDMKLAAYDLDLPNSFIYIVYPDNTIRVFREPFERAQYPLWYPPPTN